MEPNPIDGMTVELVDAGQDFLEFDIRAGRIVDTRPFQAFAWNGKLVLNESIAIGDHIDLKFSEGPRTVLYPVIAIRPLAKVQIAPLDV